jgi:D-glycero-D-manno-heptose 1,7-bisphosphate phosphatase
MKRAVFLDRDGVLIEDVHLLTRAENIHILPGVPGALRALKQAGLELVVVSNQTVVARGLLTEPEVLALHQEIGRRLEQAGAPALDGFYYCPHHPEATLTAYRVDCTCRKPRPGLILAAAADRHLSLPNSYLVGDRPTDIVAGQRAGCRTVWVRTGQHQAPPIQSADPLPERIDADFVAADLAAAVACILNRP